jgi:hypothetical protein
MHMHIAIARSDHTLNILLKHINTQDMAINAKWVTIPS